MNTQLLESAFKDINPLLCDSSPSCTVVLGSGWSSVTDSFDLLKVIDYSEIPVMGHSRVKGHAGRLMLLGSENRQFLTFQGRHHFYEGLGWDPVAFPVYLTKRLGIPSILLTNSAGAVSPSLKPGNLMIIDDHINDMGSSPLCGEYDPFWGPQFPDQSSVYSPELSSALDAACIKAKADYSHGIYAAKCGPTYETPAEIRALALNGVSAVGMSTVPEAILANSAGLNVAGLSCITNYAAGICETPLSHEEVLRQTELSGAVMSKVIFETLLAI